MGKARVEYKKVDQIQMLLNEYSDEIRQGIEDIIEELADYGVEELKSKSPKDKGKYRKNWAIKKKFGTNYVNFKIHNKKTYGLTHLLEYGHATRDGGHTKKYPHIKGVEQTIINDFQKRVNALIKGGK
jgi:hypothetical protein